jgi:SAM-dependent methyltransferase
MSYRLLSYRPSDQHDVDQWNYRTLEGELRSFEGRTLVRIFERFLDEHASVLEAGCGFGAWCEWFRHRGHRVVGVEYDERVVARAKAFKADIAVELGDITELRFPEDHFDAYVSLGVIEHFEHGPQQALAEARRVLKPGGLAFFSTPTITPIRRVISHPTRTLYFLIRRLRGKPSYFWEYRFTEKELRGFLEDAGFDIVHVDIDDYEPGTAGRHIGLSADWFFLRKTGGEIWELNTVGRVTLALLRVVPASWYAAGLHVVARAKK